MYIIDTLQEITFYRLGLMFKTIGSIIFIVVPIVIMLFCIGDIMTIVFKPDEARTQIKTVVDRIIAGLIIFILPTIIGYAMTLVESYDKNTVLKYIDGASKEKIESLQMKYQQEEKADINLKEAEYKEAARQNAEAERKRRESAEEMFSEYKNSQNNNNNTSNTGNNNTGTNNSNNGNANTTYTGDTNSNGKYGSVTVSNGVFTIPNRRATSDSDIPKQSGQYGLNPVFWKRLNKFIQAGAQAGHKITVSSGWRSYSSQRRLWDTSSRPCSTRSKWVACPGGSRHGFGIAADLKFNGNGCAKGTWNCNSAAKWAHDNAGRFGLKFRMSWEPWHIEPDQVRGGSFGSCNARC